MPLTISASDYTSAATPSALPNHLIINPIWDSSVTNLPPTLEQRFVQAVEAAIDFFETFTDPMTVTIDFGYGINPSPFTNPPRQAVADSAAANNIAVYAGPFTYDQVKSLVESEPAPAGNEIALPATDPTAGGQFYLTTAQEKLLGLIPATQTTSEPDGWVAINSSMNFDWDLSPFTTVVPNQIYAVGLFEHEISEVLGRSAYGGTHLIANMTNAFTLMDLFRTMPSGSPDPRYTSGTDDYTIGDVGRLPLNNPNLPADGVLSNGPASDMADWANPVKGDSFGTGWPGMPLFVSASDLGVMAALGYHPPTQSGSVGPAITGAGGSLTVGVLGVHPFANIVVSDNSSTVADSAEIALSNYGADGTLTGAGVVNEGNGFYVVSGTSPSDLTAKLRAVLFRGRAGSSATTEILLQVENLMNSLTTKQYQTAVAVTGRLPQTGKGVGPGIASLTGQPETFAFVPQEIWTLNGNTSPQTAAPATGEGSQLVSASATSQSATIYFVPDDDAWVPDTDALTLGGDTISSHLGHPQMHFFRRLWERLAKRK